MITWEVIEMKKKLFGILMAAIIVSSVPAFAAEHNDIPGNDTQIQALCCGGYYGDDGYGCYGRGYRGNQQQ